MQYMLLIYGQEYWSLPDAEKVVMMRTCDEFTQGIIRSGHFRAGQQLQPSATTVREMGHKRITTDGPFAESKEQVAGYCLVECKDLDEAISIAERVPVLRIGGSVEVRPVVSTP